MMDRENIFNHCQTILRLTDDGNKLSASDLNLVQNAINGYLTPRGEVVLYHLRYKCENGYEKPPFCGVAYLSRGDGDDRSVFWRGIRVEHYDHDFWKSEGWQERMTKAAQHLGKICQYLENNGIAVNFENYSKYSNRIK